MKSLKQRMYFAYRHSIRSGRWWTFLAALKMAYQVQF